jgi:hypothetical protein
MVDNCQCQYSEHVADIIINKANNFLMNLFKPNSSFLVKQTIE